MRFFSICSNPYKGNSYFLKSEKENIMIDVGFSKTLLKQTIYQKKVDIEKITGIFISHSHEPHVKGLKFVLELNPKIPIFASQKTFEELEFKNIENKVIIEPRKKLQLEDVIVYPFPVKHSVENMNFTFETKKEKLAYINNTGNIDKQLIEDIGKCQHFIIEAYHHPGLIRKIASWEEMKHIVTNEGHLTNEDASEIIARCYNPKMKNILICNLSKYNDETLSKLMINTIFGEKENVKIEIAPDNYPSHWFESSIEETMVSLIKTLPKEKQKKIFEEVMEKY